MDGGRPGNLQKYNNGSKNLEGGKLTLAVLWKELALPAWEGPSLGIPGGIGKGGRDNRETRGGKNGTGTAEGKGWGGKGPGREGEREEETNRTGPGQGQPPQEKGNNGRRGRRGWERVLPVGPRRYDLLEYLTLG